MLISDYYDIRNRCYKKTTDTEGSELDIVYFLGRDPLDSKGIKLNGIPVTSKYLSGLPETARKDIIEAIAHCGLPVSAIPRADYEELLALVRD